VALLLATVVAGVFAVGAYYGHFLEVYERALTRVSADSSSAAPARLAPGTTASRGAVDRAASVMSETAASVGWPILLLALVGGLVTPWRQARDPLSCAVLAWGVVWLVFSAMHVVTHVDVAYERYAIEFLGRVNLATYPAAVLLAARAVAVPWPGGIAPARVVVATVLVAAATWQGCAAWLHWFV
jgi:hypothetical protein